jgi:putative FmdB family regulatory protein
MPLFEYQCKSCGHRFEELSRAGVTPACPACKSGLLEKQLSVFAVNTSGRPTAQPAMGPCSSCGHPDGPGSCAYRPD